MLVTVTDDGSRTLFSPRYGETYRSRRGALVEARHVFLEGGGVRARLAAGLETRVLEVGFGTGLNVLVTAVEAVRTGSPLSIVSLERELLAPELLASLDYGSLLPDTGLADDLLGWLQDLPPGTSARHATTLGMARLELILGDAREVALPADVHAVYHDPFSPDANPELWTPAFLERLLKALAPGGILTSYSVKGEVQRRLRSLGFDVSKVAGPPGGKREVLVARKPGSAAP